MKLLLTLLTLNIMILKPEPSIKHIYFGGGCFWCVEAVFEDVNLREVNELIQAEDKKITISAAAVTAKPTTKDKVLISSIVHNIIRVLTKTSGGTDISYTLYLRT